VTSFNEKVKKMKNKEQRRDEKQTAEKKRTLEDLGGERICASSGLQKQSRVLKHK